MAVLSWASTFAPSRKVYDTLFITEAISTDVSQRLSAVTLDSALVITTAVGMVAKNYHKIESTGLRKYSFSFFLLFFVFFGIFRIFSKNRRKFFEFFMSVDFVLQFFFF